MKILVRLFAFIGFMGVASAIAFSLFVASSKKNVPAKTILEINLEQDFPEDIPSSMLATLMSDGASTLRDLVDAIDKGAKDKRVVGIVARMGANTLPMAKAQEIRDAIKRFRAENKFAVAFSETFGEFSPGNGSYYLSTAFDEIYLQPSGDVGLTGIMMESGFVTGALEKLGLNFRGDHRYEYKNAFNAYTEKKYTDAHKEATSAIMTSWFNQMREGICEGRKLPKESFDALVDAGPYLGQEAVDAKLVDALAYRDEVYAKVKVRGGIGAELLYFNSYLQRAGRPNQSGEKVALIYGVGAVARGESQYNPIESRRTMGSDTVADAIRAAVMDEDVKAIVFRVDSPGGSYVASDAIWREVVKAKQANKPVVVTMGNVAGSGGYFVAMAAEKIVAQPGTITASIGVLGGKVLTSGLWEKLGLSWDEVHMGKNAAMFTGTKDFSESEWSRFQAWLDRVYDDFTNKVSEGRKLPKEKVLEIAKGRIWSGQDAKERGLVDELGGFHTALKLAKNAAGLSEEDEVNVVLFPQPKSFLQKILNRSGADSSEKEGLSSVVVSLVKAIQPIVSYLRAFGIMQPKPGEQVLSMPENESAF